MATSLHQDETHMQISQDVLHVCEGQCAMNEIIAKLCDAMRNPDMRDKLIVTMEALLYDPTLMTKEGGAEQPPCGTMNLPLSCHAKEDEGLNKMHKDTPRQGIQGSAPYPPLSQEKEGSDSPLTSDSDAAPRR